MFYAYIFAAFLAVLVAMDFCQQLSRRKTMEGLATNPATNPYSRQISNKKYNEPPLGENPVYLAALNAANIEYLQNKLRDYQKVKKELDKVQEGENQNAKALAKIASQIQGAMGKNAPSHPAQLTRGGGMAPTSK